MSLKDESNWETALRSKPFGRLAFPHTATLSTACGGDAAQCYPTSCSRKRTRWPLQAADTASEGERSARLSWVLLGRGQSGTLEKPRQPILSECAERLAIAGLVSLPQDEDHCEEGPSLLGLRQPMLSQPLKGPLSKHLTPYVQGCPSLQ